MKKIFSILFLLLAVMMTAKAQYTELNLDQTDVLYIDGTVQTGTKGNLHLKMRNTDYIGTITCIFQLPEGIELDLDEVNKRVTSCGYKDGFYKLAYQKGWEAFSDNPAIIVELPVTVTAEPGTYQVNAQSYQMVHEDLTDIVYENVYTTISVRKTAVIDALPEGFDVTVTPFVAKDGDVTLKFNYISPVNIKNLSFDVQLPEGMFFVDDEEWDKSNVSSSLTASCTGVPTLSHELADGDNPTSATIKVAGTYSQKSKKYINATEYYSYSPLATISACVLTQEDVDGEYKWDKEIMTEGVYTIKLSNIVIEDVDDKKYTGESLASVIYGQPAAQEVVLYGVYDKPTAEAFTTALKNVAIADVTAALSLQEEFTDDVIRYYGDTDESFYHRTSATNFATTVLPFKLESDVNVQYYTIKSMTSESIIIEKVNSVNANEPCIFKGTIVAYDYGYPNLGTPAKADLVGTTFKGTYEATSIAAGAGYYISGGKFYSDGASIRPFRGYFEGTIAGAKSLRVLLDDATGLIDITDQFSKEDIYNLQGIRMNNVQKGINIKGGKKVLVK